VNIIIHWIKREKMVKLFRENSIFKNNFSDDIDTCVNGEKFKTPLLSM
jgi:hypothetical protein